MEDASKKEIPKSINDVMDAIAGLGEAVGLLAEQMQGMDDRLSGQIQGISGRTDGLADKMDRMETRLTRVESQMITKDYLDRKLFELRGDLILLSRQSNVKLSTLVERLVEEGSLKRSVADKILAMEPLLQ